MKDLPLLAVVFEPESVPLLNLRTATAGMCEILWIVDPAIPEVKDSLPALRRFGAVIEVPERNPDAAADALRPHQIDGIVAFADEAILWTSAVATGLGLRTNPVETAQRLLNKIEQRQALHDGGVPVPDFVGLPAGVTAEKARALASAVSYPAVVKPAIGSGGRYVHGVSDEAELASVLASIWSAGFDGNLILESELTGRSREPFGDYVSVECVVAEGVVHVVTVTGRMPLAPPYRETGAFIPSALAVEDEQEVAATAVRAAQALGVVVGCLHVEVKLTADGPRIIEVNGRIGGGGIPDLVADVTGHSMFAAAARAALGLPLPEVGAQNPGVVSYQLCLQTPLGIETSLTDEAVPALRAVDGVRRVIVRTPKVIPKAAEGSYSFLLMLYGVAHDHTEMLAAFKTMNSVARPSTNSTGKVNSSA